MDVDSVAGAAMRPHRGSDNGAASLRLAGSNSDSARVGERAPELTRPQRVFRKVLALLFGAGYALIPWYTWRPRSFKDVNSYITQIERLRARSEELDLDRLTSAEYIFSEPLWRQILSILDLTNDPHDALSIVTFFVVTVFAGFLFVRANPWVVSFLMFNPMMVDLTVSQTRSALAAALILIAYTTKSRWISWALFASTCLIHSLAFLFLTTYLLAKSLERFRGRADYVTLSCGALIVGALFGFAFAVGHGELLAAVNDRRAYIDQGDGNTFAYVAFWILLAVGLAMTYRKHYEIVWTDFYAIMMLTIPFITTFFGIAAARLIALAFPIVIEAIYSRPQATRSYIVASVVAYQVLHYMYWFV